MIQPTKELEQPIGLFMVSTKTSIVKFPDGLVGKPVFSQQFNFLDVTFQNGGIRIPPERKKYFGLDREEDRIFLSDKKFGEAFYSIYFPRLAKNNPENYSWEKI